MAGVACGHRVGRLVAVHAEGHFQRLRKLYVIFCGDVAVALIALGFCGDVLGVAEKRKVREAVNAFGGNVTIGDFGVANLALRKGREACGFLLICCVVTTGAGQF